MQPGETRGKIAIDAGDERKPSTGAEPRAGTSEATERNERGGNRRDRAPMHSVGDRADGLHDTGGRVDLVWGECRENGHRSDDVDHGDDRRRECEPQRKGASRVFDLAAHERHPFGSGPRKGDDRPKVTSPSCNRDARTRSDRRCGAELPPRNGAECDEQQRDDPAGDPADVGQPLADLQATDVHNGRQGQRRKSDDDIIDGRRQARALFRRLRARFPRRSRAAPENTAAGSPNTSSPS